MKPKLLLCLALVLSGALGCNTTRCHSNASWQPGAVSDGLQMSLSVSKDHGGNVPEFEIAIHNVGENDVALNLGMMLANGKVQLPVNIHLNITDSSGKSMDLDFADKRYAGTSGRVDDYVIPLRAGATYAMTLRLDQFVSPLSGEFETKLKPGKYKVLAEFHGTGENNFNTGMNGMLWMNFWTGNLRSNAVLIEEL
jgi:hypothetical protein